MTRRGVTWSLFLLIATFFIGGWFYDREMTRRADEITAASTGQKQVVTAAAEMSQPRQSSTPRTSAGSLSAEQLIAFHAKKLRATTPAEQPYVELLGRGRMTFSSHEQLRPMTRLFFQLMPAADRERILQALAKSLTDEGAVSFPEGTADALALQQVLFTDPHDRWSEGLSVIYNLSDDARLRDRVRHVWEQSAADSYNKAMREYERYGPAPNLPNGGRPTLPVFPVWDD